MTTDNNLLSKLLDNITFDIDNRNDQNFIRIYYDYPLQNTNNNMKALRQQVIEAFRLQYLVKNTTIDMNERERSLLNLLLEQSSTNTIQKESEK